MKYLKNYKLKHFLSFKSILAPFLLLFIFLICNENTTFAQDKTHEKSKVQISQVSTNAITIIVTRSQDNELQIGDVLTLQEDSQCQYQITQLAQTKAKAKILMCNNLDIVTPQKLMIISHPITNYSTNSPETNLSLQTESQKNEVQKKASDHSPLLTGILLQLGIGSQTVKAGFSNETQSQSQSVKNNMLGLSLGYSYIKSKHFGFLGRFQFWTPATGVSSVLSEWKLNFSLLDLNLGYGINDYSYAYLGPSFLKYLDDRAMTETLTGLQLGYGFKISNNLILELFYQLNIYKYSTQLSSSNFSWNYNISNLGLSCGWLF